MEPMTPLDLVPSLWGGLSKQPEHQRLSNQMGQYDNAFPSIAFGACLRPGTHFDRTITGLVDGGNYRLHAIDRDGDEQYLAIYGEGVIRIFELYGSEATVNYTATANTYFSSATADQMRLITVNDTTLVLNTEVAAAALDSSASYVVTREHADYDAMIATVPADGTYHRTLADTTEVPAGYFQYNAPAGDSEPATWVWATGDTQAKRYWGIPSYWTNPVINPLGLAMRLRRQKIVMTGGTYDETDALVSAKTAEAGVNTAYGANPPTYTSSGAFANYTWEEGDEILLKDWLTVTVNGGGTDTIDAFVRIAHRLSADKVVLDNSKARIAETYNPNTSQSLVTLDYPHAWPSAGDLTKDAEGIYQRFEMQYDWNANPPTTMDDIMNRIQTEFRSAGADQLLVSWETTGLSGKGEITVTSGWRGENSEIVGFYKPESDTIRRSLNSDDPVADDTAIVITDYNPSTISNHPFTYADGTHTAGTGTETLDAFDPIEGVWAAVSAPGEGFSKLDATTLPIQIERTTVSTPGSSAAVFTGARIDWRNRVSGNNDTNPTPDIFLNSVKLADIGVHRDRLVLGGDVYVQFSQAGDLFNFFLEDANDPNDADPIEMTLPSGFGGEVAFVQHIVPFRDALSIFTKAGRQFDLSDNGILTKDTAALTPTTNYRTLSVEPQTDGSTMYFAALDGRNAAIYEYFYDDNRLASRAGEISAHIPGVIPRDLRRMVAGRDGETQYVLPADGNELWIYRQFWQGNRKEMSAWAKYIFETGTTIADIAVLDGKVWMLVKRGTTWSFEWMEEGELLHDGAWEGYDAPKYYQTAEDANVYVETISPTGAVAIIDTTTDLNYTIDEDKCYLRQPPSSGASVLGIGSYTADPVGWPDPLYKGSQSIANQSTYVWQTVASGITYRVERTTYSAETKWVYSQTGVTTSTYHGGEYSTSSTADVSWSSYIVTGMAWDPSRADDPSNACWTGTGTAFGSPAFFRLERVESSPGVIEWDFTQATLLDGTGPYIGRASIDATANNADTADSGGFDMTVQINNNQYATLYATQDVGSGPTGGYKVRDDGEGNTYTEAASPTTITISDTSS